MGGEFVGTLDMVVGEFVGELVGPSPCMADVGAFDDVGALVGAKVVVGEFVGATVVVPDGLDVGAID